MASQLRRLPSDDIVQAVMKALVEADLGSERPELKGGGAYLMIGGTYATQLLVDTLVAELEQRLARLDPTPAV